MKKRTAKIIYLPGARQVAHKKNNLPSILLIEDQPINAFVFKTCLDIIKTDTELIIQRTCESASEYLRACQKLPSIIILNLSFNDTHGMQFIRKLESNNMLKEIPIVILSDSAGTQSKSKTMHPNVRECFVRPIDYFELTETICKNLN